MRLEPLGYVYEYIYIYIHTYYVDSMVSNLIRYRYHYELDISDKNWWEHWMGTIRIQDN